MNNFNIAVTAQKGVETDPELAKKIPQFNRSEPRFIELLRMGILNSILSLNPGYNFA